MSPVATSLEEAARDAVGLKEVVLSGGRVIDPASGLDAVGDVHVVDGRISSVGPNLAAEHPGATIVDCAERIVVPGLIDLHVHVYPGFGDFCLHPDRVGVEQGVTLALGRCADVTVLGVDDGPAELSDGFETLVADRRLAPGRLPAGRRVDHGGRRREG